MDRCVTDRDLGPGGGERSARTPVGRHDAYQPERTEVTGGRINYNVNTKDGGTYRCYMYSATGFQKAMSFGMTPHSDAICTAMAGTPAVNGQRSNNSGSTCNALLQAAGRC